MTNEKINSESLDKLVAEFDSSDNANYRYSSEKSTKQIIKDIRDAVFLLKEKVKIKNTMNNGTLPLRLTY
ncbi:hypothetical protein RM768_004687 [Enterobacter asburiae]|nr:hypothetical protein [Enterobacter asburiae]ELF1049633.1 hypothetical protein [Enterobacter asburiae]